jgi:elongation factor Ts
VKEAIAALGENIVVRRAERLAPPPGQPAGSVASYIHAGGKIGVLVELAAATAAAARHEQSVRIARDVAMQVAAMAPRWVRREEVPAAVLEEERTVLRAQSDLRGKPPAVQAKIVEGRLGKFYGEACLLDQPFIKDEARKATVGDALLATSRAAGGALEVRRFIRFKVGEAL